MNVNDASPELGYFLDYRRHWLQGLALLKHQLAQLKESKKHKPNRHFNTLDMYHYSSLEENFPKLEDEGFFTSRIANNRFYGLSKEFEVASYTVPKSGLGLRKYKFMTCPMRVLYYAIGIYILELSQEYLKDYSLHKRIHSWYGGNLSLNPQDNKLNLSVKSIYYKSHYQKFRRRVTKENEAQTNRKVVIHLDVENYFDEINIPVLLDLLKDRIKPSIQRRLKFDETTQAQIVSFFEFVAGGTKGIPQQNNDVISSFIGHLFLAFGDSFLNDEVLLNNDSVKSFAIIRYVDDIYVAITFEEELGNIVLVRNSLNLRDKINSLVPLMSDCLYKNLKLRLNPKSMFYRPADKNDRLALERNLKKVSQGVEIPDERSNESAQIKIAKIIDALTNLKHCRRAPYFQQPDELGVEEPLKEIYGGRVQDLLRKPDIKSCLTEVFLGGAGFDFELVNAYPVPIIILMLACDDVPKKFEEFLLTKDCLSSRDVRLTISYLCQTWFSRTKLFELIKQNAQMKKIIEIIERGWSLSESPGYYALTVEQTFGINRPNINKPHIIEQVRLRILAEQKANYPVALNHLLNEIHAICHDLVGSPETVNDFTSENVAEFLKISSVPHKTCTKIRNLFDRRNKSTVSHADPIAWGVTKDEYDSYRFHVGKCLEHLL